jgi:hypothetical protein
MKTCQSFQTVTVYALTAIALTGLSAESVRISEPIYDGKLLSDWINDYEHGIPRPCWSGNVQTLERSADAIREIGTNSLPWLLQELSAREITDGDRLPTNYYSGEAIKRRWVATHAFAILGSALTNATPQLVELLKDEQTSYTAAIALQGVGPASIPVLIQALTNQNACARESAARVLGTFGTNAESAISYLVKCATESDCLVRSFATFSLGQINKEPDVVVPVLATNLSDSDQSTRINAALALARFGTRAKSVIPALLKAVEENDSESQTWALRALAKINERDLPP